ncbi:MAG TPA: Ig-like domain-containing protein [Gemmatimonadales bacterium]|nr:Ig-like domain-containing protein [Gemmatimonadales bacterium]
MLLSLLLVLAQEPQQPAAPSPVSRVEVTPPRAEVQIGQTLQFQARALDAAGQPVPGVRWQWFNGGNGGSMDSTGVLTAEFMGTARVVAVARIEGKRSTIGEATVKVLPQPASRIEFAAAPARVVVGSHLTLSGTPYSAQGDRRYDAISFSSSNSRIATVTEDGRLTAVAPGKATITAKAGIATATFTTQVVPNTVARLALEPAATTVRTGDVVHFSAKATDAAGKPVKDVGVRWSVVGGSGVAQVDESGAFVAEVAGKYAVAGDVGGKSAEAIITVGPRNAGRGFEVLGRVPITERAAEVWVHQNGKCAYMSTIADRVYAIDVSDGHAPKIVDSMMTNARIVNDVMTTEDGKYGVFSREGASDRKNGIVVFDASDACHPKPIAEYTETVSGGVHSSYVYRGHVYLTDDATGSMRVIDIRDPYKPREVARWQTEQAQQGRYLHDVMVADGLAYLSYWDDGLVILDVGNGMKGGSPESPKLVSQFKYDLDALYARVDQYWGLSARGTHTAWRHGKYVFIGDEVYASRPTKGLEEGNDLTFGRMQVLDVSNIEQPKLVAWYEPTDGGVHNIWVEGDTLYMGNYQGGARAVDISGELKGDLLRQGREIAWTFTADDKGAKPRSTFAWGAVVKDGTIYVPDINSGLWILRLEPKQAVTP